MKKILAILLSVVCALVLCTGCGDDSSKVQSQSSSEKATSIDESTQKVRDDLINYLSLGIEEIVYNVIKRSSAAIDSDDLYGSAFRINDELLPYIDQQIDTVLAVSTTTTEVEELKTKTITILGLFRYGFGEFVKGMAGEEYDKNFSDSFAQANEHAEQYKILLEDLLVECGIEFNHN